MDRIRTTPLRAANTIGAGFAARLNAALGVAFTWLDRHRQRRLLHGLSDHMLKDIGVSRADAEREARKRFWHG